MPPALLLGLSGVVPRARRDLGYEWFQMRSPADLIDIVMGLLNLVKEEQELDNMIPHPRRCPSSISPESSGQIALKRQILLGEPCEVDDGGDATKADAYKSLIEGYRDRYLCEWGLGDVDAAFVEKHGPTLAGPHKTHLLLRVLTCPAYGKTAFVEDDPSLTDKTDELRVRCIREVVAALGLDHALDVERRCGDYWMEPFDQSRLYKMASVFHSFERTIPLFRTDPRRPKAWTRPIVTHVLDSVFGAIGLKIKAQIVRRQEGTSRIREYTYKLDDEHVADMREFLALKLKATKRTEGVLPLQPPSLYESLLRQPIERHARLLVRRPKPPTPSPSDAEEGAEDEETSPAA